MSGTDPMATLVIGGDSLCGRAIAEAARRQGRVVVETSRRGRDGTVPFDLRRPDYDALAGHRYASAYLCAAVTNMKACEDDPASTAEINVIGTLETLRWLAVQGTPAVFLSSSQVFDGESPAPDEDAPTHPRNAYGRQKRSVELAIEKEDLPCAVLRLTKVLAPRPIGLFKDWYEALRRGEPITAARNLPLSPISVEDVAHVAQLICGHGGIWHLSAKDEILYSDAARFMAEIHGFPTHLVRAEDLTEGQVPSIFRHRYTVIGTQRIERTFGFPIERSRDLLERLFESF